MFFYFLNNNNESQISLTTLLCAIATKLSMLGLDLPVTFLTVGNNIAYRHGVKLRSLNARRCALCGRQGTTDDSDDWLASQTPTQEAVDVKILHPYTSHAHLHPPRLTDIRSNIVKKYKMASTSHLVTKIADNR